MAEPYVPIAQHNNSSSLLTELEVATNQAKTNSDALGTARSNALSSKTSAESLLAQKFNLMFMVGA
jgi:hypothetical protein